jgi:pilus assembly protein Flp/PilA
MLTIAGPLQASVRAQGGQTLVEYGILIAVVAVIVVVAALTLGGSISALFSNSAHHV